MTSFKRPRSLTDISACPVQLSHGSKAILSERLARHGVCQELNVVLPGLNQLPVELQSFLDDQAPRFHLARATRLDALLAADGYLPLLRGDQAMVCSVADHDGDMSVYTRTRQRIFLALSESLYQSCGLTGKPDKHHRYQIELDLSYDAMRAGKPGLERVKRCLARLPPVDLLIVGSGALSLPPGVQKVATPVTLRRFDRLPLPSFDALQGDDAADIDDLATWASLVALGSPPPISASSDPTGPVHHLRLVGALHPSQVEHLLGLCPPPYIAIGSCAVPRSTWTFLCDDAGKVRLLEAHG